MKHIIEKWLSLQTSIHEFHNPKSIYTHNVIEAIKRIRALGKFIEENEEGMQTWLQEYLQRNREEVFLRYWLETGNEYLLKYLEDKRENGHIHSRITEWASMFENAAFPTYDGSFDKAKTIVKTIIRRMDPDLCDDEETLAIHKDKQCVSNGWYCDYCEDLEQSWKQKLIQQAKQSNNVFLNKSLHDNFIKEVLQSSIVHRIPNPWAFPKIYNGLYAFFEKPIETKEEMFEKAKKQRSVYQVQGKTPFQSCTELLSMLSMYCTGWSIQLRATDSEWHVFRYMMNKLETLLYVIPLDLAKCKEIEEMF